MRPRDSTARGRPLCMRGTGRGMRDEGGGPGLRGGGGGRAEPPRLAVGPSFLPPFLSLSSPEMFLGHVCERLWPTCSRMSPGSSLLPGTPPAQAAAPGGAATRFHTTAPAGPPQPDVHSPLPCWAGWGDSSCSLQPAPSAAGPAAGAASSGDDLLWGGLLRGWPPLGGPPLGGGLQSESSRGAHLAAAALPQRPRLLPLPLPVREDAGASLRAERGRGEGALHRWTASSSVLVHGFSPSAGSGRNLFQDAHFFGIVPVSRPQMRFSLT